jgi:hypothetical protein
MEGIEYLATKSGTETSKIKSAFEFICPRIQREDLPEKVRDQYDYIWSNLTDIRNIPDWDKENKMGAIYHSCNKLNSSRIKKIKKCMWSIFVSLTIEVKYPD